MHPVAQQRDSSGLSAWAGGVLDALGRRGSVSASTVPQGSVRGSGESGGGCLMERRQAGRAQSCVEGG